MAVLDSKDEKNTTDAAPTARSFGRDLTTGSIPRHLIVFSLPMLAGTALQTAYSFINAIWVGQFLGKTALAAVTVSFPVIFVLMALVAGLTMATNILISQHWGARDLPAVRKVVDSSCILISFLSLALLACGEWLTPAILRAMHTETNVLPLAIEYMRIFLLTLPMWFGLFLIRAMLQGIGDSKTIMVFQIAGVALNAALDPVLMFGWFALPTLGPGNTLTWWHMPALGLNGTAWATVICNVLAIAVLMSYLRKRRNPVAPAINFKRFDSKTAWTTVRIGVPSALQQSLISVGMIFVTGIVNSFGENATAAFGCVSRIDQLAFMPALTFSMAISTLAGQNIGANRHDRIREILKWGCILSGGVTVACSILVVCLPRVLLRIFTNDPAVLDLGIDYLYIVGSCYAFFAIMFVSNGIINGSGHTMVTTAISLISLWVVRVPMAWWLSRRIGSIDGVWYAVSASFGVSMLVSMAYYFTGRWRRPVARKPSAAGPAAVFGDETGEA